MNLRVNFLNTQCKWFEINRPLITKYKPLEVESKTSKRKDGTIVEFIEILPEQNTSETKEIVFLHG